VEVLTVYAFSTENWKRPREEIKFLFELMDEALERDVAELRDHGVRLRFMGRHDAIDPELVAKLKRAEELTKENDRLILNIGFNYGGRAEIVDAVKSLVERAMSGKLDPQAIDEELLSQAMYTSGLPD